MAINTRDKRGSVLGVSGEWAISLPTPGTYEQGDRRQVTGLYRGILNAGVVSVASMRAARYTTPMCFIQKQDGIERRYFMLYPDGSEMMWGNK